MRPGPSLEEVRAWDDPAASCAPRRIVLPRRNEHDLDDVPADARRALDVVLVDSVDEVLPAALVERPRAQQARPGEAEHAAPAPH